MEQFADIVSGSFRKIEEWISKNGIDHNMTALCYHRVDVLRLLLEKGISLDTSIWESGILDDFDAMKVICELRRDQLPYLCRYYGLVENCTTPAILDLLFKNGVSVDTKQVRYGVPVKPHFPSYYITDPVLLELFIANGAKDLDYESIIRNNRLLRSVPKCQQIQDIISQCEIYSSLVVLKSQGYDLTKAQLDLIDRVEGRNIPRASTQEAIIQEPEEPSKCDQLCLAIYEGDEQKVFLLLSSIVNCVFINDVSSMGEGTALMIAVKYRHLKIAKFLISKRADVNCKDAIKKDAIKNAIKKDSKLMTPLMLAVANADIQMVHLILSRNPAMLTRVGTPEKDVMDIVLEHENKQKSQALMDIIYPAYSKAITERY